MGRGMFHPRYSHESLSHGDKEDPKGLIFTGAGIHDLSNIHVIGHSLDTVRQIYRGTLKEGLVDLARSVIDRNDEFFYFSDDSEPWYLSKMGKSSGYQYKLQNNMEGFILLFKRFHASATSRETHLKIEVSPQAIRRIGSSNMQKALNKLAEQVLNRPEPAGIVVHLAADVQGWDFPNNFESRFVTRAVVRRKDSGWAGFRPDFLRKNTLSI
ncbi:MAG: hypothetical protein H7839_21325 [Magnetococcus sp. YQC-5]